MHKVPKRSLVQNVPWVKSLSWFLSMQGIGVSQKCSEFWWVQCMNPKYKRQIVCCCPSVAVVTSGQWPLDQAWEFLACSLYSDGMLTRDLVRKVSCRNIRHSPGYLHTKWSNFTSQNEGKVGCILLPTELVVTATNHNSHFLRLHNLFCCLLHIGVKC